MCIGAIKANLKHFLPLFTFSTTTKKRYSSPHGKRMLKQHHPRRTNDFLLEKSLNKQHDVFDFCQTPCGSQMDGTVEYRYKLRQRKKTRKENE